MEKIKLMADYGCYPIWWVGSGKAGDIDPETLPLSKETINRLEKWADIYDAKLNWQDPGNSPGFSPEEEAAFENEGISLWKQLQKELAPNYEIVYFSETLRKVVTDINELASSLPQNWDMIEIDAKQTA
ncbi:MAG: hypothetical protein F6K62_05135 [Sphaerospermopsis sp. SIO1G2]|nr:hypothetical protein [Sphaerospermopsis sp. SIO1G2]